jgi:hypothetical protein
MFVQGELHRIEAQFSDFQEARIILTCHLLEGLWIRTIDIGGEGSRLRPNVVDAVAILYLLKA